MRVGTWPWIHLSCSLLTKQYDMSSTQNVQDSSRWLLNSVLSAMASTQIGAHKTFQSSREVGMTEKSWGSWLWLDILARIVGRWCHQLLASDWFLWQGELDWLICHVKVASDGSYGQVLPLKLQTSSTVRNLNVKYWMPSSGQLIIVLLQYSSWAFWDHLGWSWNGMWFLIISKTGTRIH
jgi:hypothetical protein